MAVKSKSNLKLAAVDDVPTVTEAQVNSLMDLVIAKNIFHTVNGNSIGKKDAKIVTTESSDVEVA